MTKTMKSNLKRFKKNLSTQFKTAEKWLTGETIKDLSIVERNRLRDVVCDGRFFDCDKPDEAFGKESLEFVNARLANVSDADEQTYLMEAKRQLEKHLYWIHADGLVCIGNPVEEMNKLEYLVAKGAELYGWEAQMYLPFYN